jgi:uncharacterized protein
MKLMPKQTNQLTDTGVAVAPRFLLTWAWAILLVLVLVFARDINAWAVGDETQLQDSLQPAAMQLEAGSQALGVTGVREYVQGAVQGFYRDAPQWSAKAEATAPAVAQAAATPVQTIADAELPAKPAKPKPVKILLIGDSSIQAGLGTELERRLEECEGVTVMRFGLHSTGLARPDYFNWMTKLTELKKEFDPDLTIAYFGDNDCQGLASVDGKAVAKFGSDEWKSEYGKRVQDIMGLMKEGGNYGAMVGMPIMRSKKFSNQIQILNGVLEKATLTAGGVYLPTWGITSDASGNYVASVEFEGKDRMIRQGDGIHLSEHGADYVAYHLIEMLKAHYVLVEKAK